MTRHTSLGLFGLCQIALTLGIALFGSGLIGKPALAQDDYGRCAYDRYAPSLLNSHDGTFSGFDRRPSLDPLPQSPADRDPFRAPTRDPSRGLPVPDRPEETKSEAQLIAERIDQRYRSPVVVRFVGSLSNQQSLALYREAMQLIDSRHLQPTSYDDRVKQALHNLTVAVESPAFLQAHGINPSPDRIRAFQDGLRQLAVQRPVQSSADARNVLLWTGDLAQRQLGLRPTTVVAEFVYGAVESLDKYSAFEPENPRQPSPSAALEDHVVGIGVEIKPHDEGVLVVKVLRDSPAMKAGVQKDDVIVSIDGRPLRGQSLDYAVDLIAGPLGSRLSVGIVRDGRQQGVTMTRNRVEIHSVSEVRMLDDTTGYIKVDTFAQDTEQEVDQALWNLHRQGMQSLVIDMRGNPGGLLTTAVSLSDKFLASGSIVSTRGRTAQDQSAERAEYAQTWKTPLVVLVDGDSASASEIFAAAIQENNRGLIVGRRTYGKGTVQTHFPLQTAAGTLRLTTAKFYSPKGRAMAETGVTPDVQLDQLGYRPGMTADGDRALEIAARVADSTQLRELAQLGPALQIRGNR